MTGDERERRNVKNKLLKLHITIEVEEMPISPALRGSLEKSIDNVLKYPKKNKMMFTEILKLQDIEPDLERILSYIIGLQYGIITGKSIILDDRVLNEEEMNEIMAIIKRRMHEMREALVDPR